MVANLFRRTSPGLLVSVRNASEAMAALAGGADVIDVKEPTRGSLGAADVSAIRAVVTAIDGASPVTVAMGELLELQSGLEIQAQRSIPDGVMAFKIGLAGCAKSDDWQSAWYEATLRSKGGRRTGAPYPVGVAYADWRAATAPNPSDVLNAARDLDCPAILVDTWDKSCGTLFDHLSANDLCDFIVAAHRINMSVVLAGSLHEADISRAASLSPDLVAVRTAVCEGGRNGTINAARVRQLKNAIAASALKSDHSGQALFPETAKYLGVKA